MEPTETTLTGNRLWIVIGVLAVVVILVFIGIYNQPARLYIDGVIKTILGVIPAIR